MTQALPAPTDARLEDDEVVRIAGGQRQVLNFRLLDRATQVRPCWLENGSSASHLHLSAHAADLHRRINHRFSSGLQNHILVLDDREPIFLNCDGIAAEGQVGKNVIAIAAAICGTRITGLGVRHSDVRVKNRGAARVCHSPANRAIDGL